MLRTSSVRLLLVATAAISSANLALARADDEPADDAAKKPRALFNGKNLDGWQVAKKFDFEEHGAVEVKEDAIILGSGKPATGIRYAGKTKLPTSNYEISLDAKRVEGDDFFCGLTFPVGEGFCTLIVGGWGGGVTGLSNVDGMSAVDNETTGYTEFKNDQWYKIRLRVTDANIEAWIDDEQIVDLKTTDRKFAVWWEQEPARPLGIVSWNTKAALRNIKLTTGDGDKQLGAPPVKGSD